ncbi:MAG: alpha/beta hydrolase [Pseudomonadota bacterium]|nr:alpha/beta hydrolase [Pseudomonadota bacterium]
MPEIILTGPAGRLEARYHPAGTPGAPVALLMPPHPQYGGTMNHPLMHSMQRAFAAEGCSVLRFNFRGVGRSQGQYDRGEGELGDAAAALDWLQSVNTTSREIWVGGFAFGAWISMQLLMRRPEISSFVSVAPPAHHYDFSFLAPCPSSGLIIHGGQDAQIPEISVARLVIKLGLQKDIRIDYRVIPQANHFFVDCMGELEKHISQYVREGARKRVAREAPVREAAEVAAEVVAA